MLIDYFCFSYHEQRAVHIDYDAEQTFSHQTLSINLNYLGNGNQYKNLKCIKYVSMNMAKQNRRKHVRVVLDILYRGGWVRIYRQTSNIRSTLAGNKLVDHADVVGASPIGAAPTTSLFST